jgi:hypothetical protein
MPAIPSPRRKRHPAHRARNIAAGVSATAFLGLGAAMALAPNAGASAASPAKSSQNASTTPTTQSTNNLGDSYSFGNAQSLNRWGAQPQQGGAASSTSGGGNTTTHGS